VTIGIDVLAWPDLASSGAYMYDMPPVGCPLPVLVVVYEVDQHDPTTWCDLVRRDGEQTKGEGPTSFRPEARVIMSMALYTGSMSVGGLSMLSISAAKVE
jgi:hypothetical protein